MRLACLLLLTLLACQPVLATTDSQKIEKVLTHLRQGEGFHSKVEKAVHSGTLGSTEKSSGEIYFAQGKMRLELTTPDRILLVYDGSMAWQESEFDDGSKKRVIVTKIQGRRLRQNSTLLATLLGHRDVLKDFKISKQKGDEFDLAPVKAKNADVKSLQLVIHGDTLKSISFTDSLDNEVSFKFDDLEEQKVSAKKFKYEPPKGAEVSDV
jgi:chaperone LolA